MNDKRHIVKGTPVGDTWTVPHAVRLPQKRSTDYAFVFVLVALALCLGNAFADTRERGVDRRIRDKDCIRLMNGDMLHGTVVSASMDGAELVFRMDGVKNDFVFPFSEVWQVFFARPEDREPRLAIKQVVQMINDDRLFGQLKGLSNSVMRFESDCLGGVDLRKDDIRTVYMRERASATYDMWRDQREVFCGALYDGVAVLSPHGRGGVQWMTAGHPIRTQLDVRAAWHGRAPGFVVDFKHWFEMHDGTIARSSAMSGTPPSFPVGQLGGPGQGVLAYCVDSEDQTSSFITRGKVAGFWKMGEYDKEPGDKFVEVKALYHGAVLEVFEMRVNRWDGRYLPGFGGPQVDNRQDRLIFVGQDKISGTVKAVSDSQIQFVSPASEFEVGRDKVDEMHFVMRPDRVKTFKANTVRITFMNADQVTVELEKLSDGKMKAGSDWYGKLDVPASSVRRIEFNLGRRDDNSVTEEIVKDRAERN